MNFCRICQTRAGYACGSCRQTFYCGTSCQTFDLLAHDCTDISFDELHQGILEARHTPGTMYVIDERRVMNVGEIVAKYPDYGYEHNQALAVFGSKNCMDIVISSYLYQLQKNYLPNIFMEFQKDLRCLGDWMPVKLLGSGSSGNVIKICDDHMRCAAAKFIIYDPDSKEVEIYKIASKLGVAPTYKFDVVCSPEPKARANKPPSRIQIIVTDAYDYTLVEALNQAKDEKEIENMIDQAFWCITTLAENGISQDDPKLCNYLYLTKSKKVALTDYGEARFVDDKDRYRVANLDAFIRFMGDLRNYCTQKLTVDKNMLRRALVASAEKLNNEFILKYAKEVMFRY